MKRCRRFIQRLNAYVALALLAVPFAIVEPLKLIGLFVFGKGHWITGSVVMLFAYAGSLLVVERLFKIVKPKLLTLPWFAGAVTGFVTIHLSPFFSALHASPKASEPDPDSERA